jgi:hypothetical protein
MTGSPRGLIRAICRRQRQCLMHWLEMLI